MVLQLTQFQTAPNKHSSSISLNKSTDSSFKFPYFLKEWKTIYTSQKEILLFIAEYAAPGMLQYKFPKNVDFYNYLIDSNSFQLKNFENLRPIGQNRMTHESLVKYVRHVIHRNQNPKDCRKIEVMAYEPKIICGFGCQIHHFAHCLTVALGEGKPLLVKASPWHNFRSIFDVIMPLSETCHYYMIETHNLTAKHIDLKYLFKEKQFLPPIFPENIRKQIEEFHTDPFLWYISQIITYILRLRSNIIKQLKPIDFTFPIVGVYVRREDKLRREAKCYPIEEYMKYVQLYFRKLELTSKISKKSVYLATDDRAVIAKFRKK
ncbi:Alpha-(1,6)-fucosyltransferase [Thelohanellus kitauei]|uniref:Alpha-(1,6)-fucosyltransferase n=1 Tax=Thelohanellus kitauei TaxID=669202 RepID=A0A0C2J3V0_THEKT|nr:Alpha-(1,6)-fucosyltransferase [Thelohanellus kitauei]